MKTRDVIRDKALKEGREQGRAEARDDYRRWKDNEQKHGTTFKNGDPAFVKAEEEKPSD